MTVGQSIITTRSMTLFQEAWHSFSKQAKQQGLRN
jgi:hypothetical protein